MSYPLTFSLHLLIKFIQGLIPLNPLVNLLVRKQNGNNNTCKIQQIDRTRVTVILELVVPYSSCWSDGDDQGVDLYAENFFGELELREVFYLVVPFLEVDGPEGVHVDFGEGGIDLLVGFWLACALCLVDPRWIAVLRISDVKPGLLKHDGGRKIEFDILGPQN